MASTHERELSTHFIVYAPNKRYLETIYAANYPAYQELMLELLDLVQKSLQVHLFSQQPGLQPKT